MDPGGSTWWILMDPSDGSLWIHLVDPSDGSFGIHLVDPQDWSWWINMVDPDGSTWWIFVDPLGGSTSISRMHQDPHWESTRIYHADWGSKKLKVWFEISSVLFPILHHIDRYHVKFEGPRWLGSASSGPDKMALTPLWLKKKMFGLGGSWYSNRPARTHGFNAKIGFEKYATSPEISAKKCQILLVWFGRPILDTFWPISRDSLHIFQNRFLR